MKNPAHLFSTNGLKSIPFCFVAAMSLNGCTQTQTMMDGGGATQTETTAETQFANPSGALKNFGKVTENIFRSKRLNPLAVSDLKALGVRTVLNLQKFNEDKFYLFHSSITSLHFPMPGTTEPDTSYLYKALTILENSTYYPILVHCTFGKDRTGIVVGAYRIKNQGWSVDQAYAELLTYGADEPFGIDGVWNRKEALNKFAASLR